MFGTGSLHQKSDLIITATPGVVDKTLLPNINTAAMRMETAITTAWYKTHLLQKTVCFLWYSCYNIFWMYIFGLLPSTLVSIISLYCFPPLLLAHSPCNIKCQCPPPLHNIPLGSTCYILLRGEAAPAMLCLLCIPMHPPCRGQAGQQATMRRQSTAKWFLPTPGRTNLHFSYWPSCLFVLFVTNLK